MVLINGRDISEHTHDQVVMFIRASRESHSRELALLIRRKGVSSCAFVRQRETLQLQRVTQVVHAVLTQLCEYLLQP